MSTKYNSWTKVQLLKRIAILERDNERLEEQVERLIISEDEFTDRCDDKYNEGFDAGWRDGLNNASRDLKISDHELNKYDNVLRFA